jgi:aminoglycoside phosphotransferase (APT) family kinase protein
VLDFTDVGIGDPACDLVIAWSLLNQNSRFIFRQALESIDDNTWERGKGWALSIALIMLPYYMYSNPVLVQLAKRMIEQVLLDSRKT